MRVVTVTAVGYPSHVVLRRSVDGKAISLRLDANQKPNYDMICDFALVQIVEERRRSIGADWQESISLNVDDLRPSWLRIMPELGSFFEVEKKPAAARAPRRKTESLKSLPWESAALKVVRRDAPRPSVHLCESCDQTFRPVIAGDLECAECRAAALGRPDAEKKTGEMVWTHKTAPTLQINGEPEVLSPDEIASMRRR